MQNKNRTHGISAWLLTLEEAREMIEEIVGFAVVFTLLWSFKYYFEGVVPTVRRIELPFLMRGSEGFDLPFSVSRWWDIPGVISIIIILNVWNARMKRRSASDPEWYAGFDFTLSLTGYILALCGTIYLMLGWYPAATEPFLAFILLAMVVVYVACLFKGDLKPFWLHALVSTIGFVFGVTVGYISAVGIIEAGLGPAAPVFLIAFFLVEVLSFVRRSWVNRVRQRYSSFAG